MLRQHDALDDALMTAMMYLSLRDLKERGMRIPRERRVQNSSRMLGFMQH